MNLSFYAIKVYCAPFWYQYSRTRKYIVLKIMYQVFHSNHQNPNKIFQDFNKSRFLNRALSIQKYCEMKDVKVLSL
jgi:hypothetical protein